MATSVSSGGNPALTEQVTRLLLNFFSSSDIDDVEPLPQRIKNVNFRVHAEERRWVLKCHSSRGAVAKLKRTHELETMLFEAGFPVAELQRTRSGVTLAQDGSMWGTLHAWVDGEHGSIDRRDETFARFPKLLGGLAGALAQYHRLAGGWSPQGRRDRDFGPQRLLEVPATIADSVRRGSRQRRLKSFLTRLQTRSSEFDEWIRSSLPILYQHAEYLAGTPIGQLIDPDVTVLAHNDINWENLVFDPSFRLRALLDFDNATELPRDFDVGVVAAVLVGRRSEYLDEFVSAYEEALGRRVERRLVDLGMHHKCVRSVLWSIDAYFSGRVFDHDMLAVWCQTLYEDLPDLPKRKSAVGFGG